MIGSKANMGSSFPVQFYVHNTSDLKIKSGMFGKLNLKSANQEIRHYNSVHLQLVGSAKSTTSI
jgi:hypothetical protein